MRSAKPAAAMVYGFWGQNIGNAFFNVGGKWILEQVLGQGNVSEIQDQPGYRTFHAKHRGNPKNDLKLLTYLDTDVVVLQGPVLTTSFEALWRPSFAEFKRRGVKVVLLSAAFFRYTDEEVRAVRRFLGEFPPAIISTRDADSFERVKDLCPHTYSGIDSAFFVPKAYTPVSLAMRPYVAVTFDQYPEPALSVVTDESRVNGRYDITFEVAGLRWGARQPWLQTRLADAGQWQCYLGALVDYRKLPSQVGDYTIVRLEHRYNPHITWKIYSQPNAVASDEPYTYFTVYSGAEFTLSDRVHACVATLAYGKPAMLYHPTPRARLFERLDLKDIRLRPVVLDPAKLEEERQNELHFLKDAFETVLN